MLSDNVHKTSHSLIVMYATFFLCTQVCAFLEANGHDASTFEDYRVDGVALHRLTDDDLRNLIGMSATSIARLRNDMVRCFVDVEPRHSPKAVAATVTANETDDKPLGAAAPKPTLKNIFDDDTDDAWVPKTSMQHHPSSHHVDTSVVPPPASPSTRGLFADDDDVLDDAFAYSGASIPATLVGPFPHDDDEKEKVGLPDAPPAAAHAATTAAAAIAATATAINAATSAAPPPRSVNDDNDNDATAVRVQSQHRVYVSCTPPSECRVQNTYDNARVTLTPSAPSFAGVGRRCERSGIGGDCGGG